MGTHPIFESDFDCLTEIPKSMLRVLSRNGRRVLSVSSRRGNGGDAYLGAAQYGDSQIDAHTVNQADIAALQENPDYNINYHDNPRDAFPVRPFMLGRPGTALEALRAKEQGDWNDLTMAEKEDLYRNYFAKTYLELWQGTDMWKGVLGVTLIFMCMYMDVYYRLNRDVFGFEPGHAEVWYMHSPGWQQDRKNVAALNIMWEMDGELNERDWKNWDYVNHCWKLGPKEPRIDTA